MNKFRKYSKITNSYNHKFLSKLAEHGYYDSNIKFGVQEKIHGSNVSVYYDGKSFNIASRNDFLAENQNFYNIDSIKPELFRIANSLYDYYGEDVIVYGELYGSSFPGLKSTGKQIQKGCYYSNELLFSVFDISLSGKLIDVYEQEEVCEKLDIPFCDLFMVGTLTECLMYDENFTSTISVKLGMPVLDIPNEAEGIVIRPMFPTFIGDTRCILKKKSDKFAEKNSAKKRIPKEIAELSEEMTETLENFAQYVNINRLQSLESKIGELEQRRIGEFMKGMYLDVIEDAAADGFNPDFYDKAETKIINKFINDQSKKIIFGRIKGEL